MSFTKDSTGSSPRAVSGAFSFRNDKRYTYPMAKKGDSDGSRLPAGRQGPMALYRKYRPVSFADGRGQAGIVSVLEAAG